MESLNISKLNLYSGRSRGSQDNGVKFERTEEKFETNSLTDQDEEYHCEYKEEIWKNLLEQEADKPTIHLQSPQINDADLNILHVDVTFGGATHDSFVFSNTRVKEHLENLNTNGEKVYLLGDSGYPQRPYLMNPFSNPETGTPESHYNNLHSSARNSVERTIGILKGRFRCLLVHRVLHYDPIMVGKIVIACCVLHNMCNRAGLPVLKLDQCDLDEESRLLGYLRNQLEFRGALVQQLRDVTKKLGLCIATLHSAVAQLDLFMDAHRLRADRLTHVALACLSLAAKSEEKFSRAPTLKILSKISGVQLCGKTFRQLEWMVGQHVRWRLLAPTPVTYAALLAQYVVTDSDLTTRHPKFVRRFRRDGAKLLEAYLDLTLSDVRLKVVECVDVGCACVACARAALGLAAWPAWLAARARRQPAAVAPIARLLMRMMQILKSRETSVESDLDQGYSSARTSPNQTPSTSPSFHVSPASSTCSTSSRSNLNVDTSYRQRPVERRPDANYSVLDLEDSNVPQNNVQDYYTLPTAVDMTLQRVNTAADYRYCRSRRLVEASLEVQPSTSMAVKRGLEANVDLERKRYRLASQMSQVVL